MSTRTQITLDDDLQRRARAKAAALGVSFAEYVRQVLSRDLGDVKPAADVSIIFDLIQDGEPTDIARDKDKMIGGAVWEEYLEDVGRRPRRSRTGVAAP